VNGPAVLLITQFHLAVKVKAAHSHTFISRPKFIHAAPVFFTFIVDALMHIIMLFSYNSCQLDRIGLAFVCRDQHESNSRERCRLKKRYVPPATRCSGAVRPHRFLTTLFYPLCTYDSYWYTTIFTSPVLLSITLKHILIRMWTHIPCHPQHTL